VGDLGHLLHVERPDCDGHPLSPPSTTVLIKALSPNDVPAISPARRRSLGSEAHLLFIKVRYTVGAMTRSSVLLSICVAFSLQGCLSVDAGRETAAQHSCRFNQKCGDIGPGKSFATIDECLTKARADWQDTWPTSSCDGKMNPDKFNVCITAIDNTQCNNIIDLFATGSKCARGEVCTAGSSTNSCNCGNGQTCCSNSCTNLQTDRNNCGGCGTTCGAGFSCQSGVCR
jgi:hypothetical protein